MGKDCVKLAMNKIHKISKRLLTVICLLSAAITAIGSEKIHLVDNNSGERLVLASILDKNGNVVALTGSDGDIPDLSPISFPVTFTYIGYESLEVNTLPENDIALTPKALELSEVVIIPGSHPLLHLTGYMREYASSFGSSDSLTIYHESVVDFMIPVEKTKIKGWRKPRILAENNYIRHTDSKGLDSVSNQVDDLYLWASYVNIFPSSKHSIALPSSVAEGSEAESTTIMNPDKTRTNWQKSGDMIRMNHDVMTRYENHVYSPSVLKLLGATIDITEAIGSYVFINSDGDGQLRPTELSQISRSMKMTGRGKMWKWAADSKAPVDMKSYIEIYITDMEYLTESEAKDIKKNPPTFASDEIVAPAGAPALHPGIKNLVRRVKGE